MKKIDKRKYRTLEELIDEISPELSIKFRDDKIKRLEKELNEWYFQMAYFTKEDIPTPKGVNKFIRNILKGYRETVERLEKLERICGLHLGGIPIEIIIEKEK